MKTLRPILRIDENLCNGCGQCILDCAEGAIAIENGKAKIIAEFLCDGLGACLGGCPTGALTLIEREVAPYDEAAVEQHLAAQGKAHVHAPAKAPSPFSAPAGCAGAKSLSFSPGVGNKHWPLKLGLVSPDAPFLKKANLLLGADCTAFAAPALYQSLAKDRVAIIACPKFEGQESLVQRLTAIFTQAQPTSCLVVRMEVPCCQALMAACTAAQRACVHPVQISQAIVTRQGELAQTPPL